MAENNKKIKDIDFEKFKKITSSFLLFSSEQSLYETYKDFKKLLEYVEKIIKSEN